MRWDLRFTVLYPRRLESPTICRCNYKGRTFYSVILKPWVLVRPESIGRFHKWRPLNYDSYVYVLIRPTSLVLKEHFFCILTVLTRLVGLISTKTIEHFCLAAIYAISLWLRRATVFRDVTQRSPERFRSGSTLRDIPKDVCEGD